MFDGAAGAFTMVIILGGILSGVFTATEAGAAACVYALFLTIFVYKEIKWRDLPEIIWQCCLTNAVVMLLIATCSVFSWILTYENLPRMLADNFFNLIPDKWAFLQILNIFLLIVGMFVDMTPALIMLVPILIPLAQKFGIDLVHLGLIMVINLSFGGCGRCRSRWCGRWRCRSRWCGCWLRLCRARGHIGQNILFANPPPDPGALNLIQINAMLLGEASGQGRNPLPCRSFFRRGSCTVAGSCGS